LDAETIDATYGYDLGRLLQVPAPAGPPDFADFWRATYEQTLALPLNLAHREIESPNPRFKLFEVEFDSLGGTRIGGWISFPADGNFVRGVVQGHGYGGREEPGFDVPGPPAVTIFPCASGFHRSAQPDIPNAGHAHVLHGIEQRETYIHRANAAEIWSSASVLLQLFPHLEQLHYMGGSFGGGIGALAIAWEPRFQRAYLDVPSFGNHPLRVTLPCGGSGESVRLLHQSRPEVLDVLQYFDAATAARYTEIPVFVAAALSDPGVPPPGQFAVYNGLAGEKELFVRQTGHPNTPEDDTEIHSQLARWFSV
jgi:cephalosporin-C deacetylase